MSDDNFDEESFAAYENELYGLNNDSDSDVESEIEDALYSQVHHSFSLPDNGDVDDKGESDMVDLSKPPAITISDDDDDDEKNHDGFSTTKQDIDSNLEAQNKSEEESHDGILENWDLIDKDMEVESKGKGGVSRYYAPDSKNSDKRCHNCNEKGHLAKDCPVPKKISCILCGIPGHTRVKCPNQLCFNCSQPGHRSFECSEFRVRWTDECRRCYQKGHHSKTCPDIWRQYHRTTVEGVPPVRAEKCKDSSRPMYCYNCSAHGHYGYECVEERPLDRAPFSTVQYIVRYDRHCYRPFSKIPKSDSPKRTHDRGKEYKDKTHVREMLEEHTRGIQYQEEEFQKRLHDRQCDDSRQRTHDRDKECRHRTYDHREVEANRTLDHGRKVYGSRTHNREREDYRNGMSDQDNSRTPKGNRRKRILDGKIDECAVEKHNKRIKTLPSKIRRFEGDGHRDYIAGRLKNGRIDRGSEILENEGELADLRIDDVEIHPKGSKKKKKSRNKQQNPPDKAETSCLITIQTQEQDEKKKAWKNKRAVEYNSDSPIDDRLCLTRTVQLADLEEKRKNDNLMRIVDDWERINDNQDKQSMIASIQRKRKHNKKEVLPVVSHSQRSGPVFSHTDSSPGPIPRRKGCNSIPKFEHRNVNFNLKSQEKKWPKAASKISGRGFRSKKKFYTL